MGERKYEKPKMTELKIRFEATLTIMDRNGYKWGRIMIPRKFLRKLEKWINLSEILQTWKYKQVFFEIEGKRFYGQLRTMKSNGLDYFIVYLEDKDIKAQPELEKFAGLRKEITLVLPITKEDKK